MKREPYLMSPMQPLSSTARFIGYARVSTEDQKLDMQLDALKGAGCEHIFRDHGISGAKADRPGLTEALDALEPGDMLIVYKLDRLGRSVLNLADLLRRLDEEGVQFWSLTEGINTATSGGKLIFHIFAAVAEFHRDLIRENTRNGLRAARERGAAIGRPRLMSVEDAIEAHRYLKQSKASVEVVAARFDVSTSTLLRAIRSLGLC